ncbi:hypothetical protein NHX12_031363 [Muraenolepis orangiensis]|uniref:Protein amnionless n=1 Tax=Muraenolepis orangiensis TaxID=630683 RepID=A0A9Q0E7C3_9TELE|nr:hypothetical protein NHX12_031363 [Muraenolepis orangiensis]
MLTTTATCLLLCLIGETHALYKQWIPDTNYENRTNWMSGVVPCGRDRVVFSARGSVYVETTHSVQEMTLPIDGEFILSSGAGFYIGGPEEPGCGTGEEARFKDSDPRWFDPALWQAAVSREELDNRRFLFSVHEDSVPCEHDDVVFRASTSFRVETTSLDGPVRVKSVSVLGETFNNQSCLDQYLATVSGRLQFHSSNKVIVKGSGCSDPSGCVCGNSANRGLICAVVACPSLTCVKPLRPAGHCCDVCGALVTLQYSLVFNLESYRGQLQDLSQAQPVYETVQVGVSKVSQPRYFLGTPLRVGARQVIQLVLLDDEAAPQSGRLAERLARDILEDIRANGTGIGITEAELQASSGGSGGVDLPGTNVGVVVGAVFGVLALSALVGVGVILVRKGHIRMPSMPSLGGMRSNPDGGCLDLGGPLDSGYDNPMFDDPTLMPGIYGAEMNPISLTHSGVHFVNPVYDDHHETDFTMA